MFALKQHTQCNALQSFCTLFSDVPGGSKVFDPAERDLEKGPFLVQAAMYSNI